ncbi:hypothetical protein BD410DRAFT_765041 [Rickenella mellea]|uniref:COQ9 C-terminal domain-containing protein n=1 Tax=Rickenella mellea TaxID=50990 RepID=A0A4Y7QFA2_9AGAM|nr:hypothetical protein BD410DRAFT_765041 [Rickenella mellea]
MNTSRLLQLAIPLVKEHGFTRKTLSLSVLSLPSPHQHPLSDTAISAIFGRGDEARKALFKAWLEQGRREMLHSENKSLAPVLKSRLSWNEPVLRYLPEAFALIASPASGIPPLDLRPALKHAATIADQACYISGDASVGTAWYTRRASLATIYAAAELHQLTSPTTAYGFLDNLLTTPQSAEKAIGEVGLFADYIGKSWAGILRSSGIF